jgi:hypothetical protein
MEVKLHMFLNLILDGGEWSGSHSGPSIPGKEPILFFWVEGCMGSGEEKVLVPKLESNHGCPVHNQSHYV